MVRRLRWGSVEDFLAGRTRPEGECLVWVGARTPNGYGELTFEGQHYRAHRFVAEFVSGQPIPPGLCVLHACDNPPCVRPEHLTIGTQRENMRDAARKGRLSLARARGDEHHARRTPEVMPRGSRVGTAKLTDEAVRKIRAARAGGETLAVLAARFGVTEKNVSLIARRETWRHVE